MSVKLAYLLPSLANLHGERGNVLALKKLAEINQIDLEIVYLELGEKELKLADYQGLVLFPVESPALKTVVDFLAPYKSDLEEFILAQKPVLVTGISLAVFGKSYSNLAGEEFPALGIFDYKARARSTVYGDNLFFKADYLGQENLSIFGFQIQLFDFEGGRNQWSKQIRRGHGNDGKTEGFSKNSCLLTNCLGPILVTNPVLAEAFLAKLSGKEIKRSLDLEGDLVAKLQYLERHLKEKREFYRKWGS